MSIAHVSFGRHEWEPLLPAAEESQETENHSCVGQSIKLECCPAEVLALSPRPNANCDPDNVPEPLRLPSPGART